MNTATDPRAFANAVVAQVTVLQSMFSSIDALLACDDDEGNASVLARHGKELAGRLFIVADTFNAAIAKEPETPAD